MNYLGAFPASALFDFYFATRRFDTGAPFTLAGTPTLRVYKDNNIAQSTSGITLDIDFDSLTGLHHVRIDTSSDGTFYSADSEFTVVIQAGTVNSVSVVGEPVGSFSLNNGQFTATAIQSIWDRATSSLTISGSIGKLLVDNITGNTFTRIGAPVGASISVDIAAVKTVIDAIKVQTDKLTFTVANQIDSNVLDWKSAVAPAMTGDAFARLGAPAGASVSADIATAAANILLIQSGFKKNTAKSNFTFSMRSSVGALVTGIVPAGTKSIDGTVFVGLANAISEIGTTGYYKVTLAAADLNGDEIFIRITGTGAVDREFLIFTKI